MPTEDEKEANTRMVKVSSTTVMAVVSTIQAAGFQRVALITEPPAAAPSPTAETARGDRAGAS